MVDGPTGAAVLVEMAERVEDLFTAAVRDDGVIDLAVARRLRDAHRELVSAADRYRAEQECIVTMLRRGVDSPRAVRMRREMRRDAAALAGMVVIDTDHDDDPLEAA